MRPSGDGIGAGRIDDQRVDRHPLAIALTADDPPGGLVPEDQRRGPAGIVAVIGVHVRAADADGLDPDEDLAALRDGIRFILEDEAVGGRVDERLHGQGFRVTWR